MRVAFGASDDCGVNPANNDPQSVNYLKNIAASSIGDAYGTLFRDSRFDTIMLTTYSPVIRWATSLMDIRQLKSNSNVTRLRLYASILLA